MPFLHRWTLVGLLALALALRLPWVGVTDLAHDEPFTVVMAHRTLPDMFQHLRYENNPPLHFLLTHFWVKFVPLDTSWLRLPSVLFSVLLIWPLFLIGRALGGFRAGVLSALLVIFSGHHQAFAHEVRSYALFALLTTTAMWQLLRASRGAPRAGWYLVALYILLVYTHFLGWVVPGIHMVLVLFPGPLRSAAPAVRTALFDTLLAYLPYAAIFYERIRHTSTAGTWLTAPEPEELYNMIWRWSNAPVLAVSFLALLMIGTWRTKGAQMRLAVTWTLAPLLGLFLLSYHTPLFLDRYLLFAAPGFALWVALAVGSLTDGKHWSWVPAALLVAGMALTFAPWDRDHPRPSAVVAQAEAWRGDGIVLLQPSWYRDAYAWHLDSSLVRHPAELDSLLALRGIHPTTGLHDLYSGWPSADRLVRVDAWADLVDPEGKVTWALDRRYLLEERVEADHKVFVERHVAR
ncbi:MAG: glycosyltransferase family 39 protein [Flavobacteriales bacterium]